MSTTKTASCCCGSLRVHVKGNPIRTSICHCTACQQRTGSVFACQVRFLNSNVTIDGASKVYERTGDSGGKIEFHFCGNCGSTVYYSLGGLPDHTVVAAGAFADSKYIPTPVFSVYEDRMHSWVVLPEGIEHMH